MFSNKNKMTVEEKYKKIIDSHIDDLKYKTEMLESFGDTTTYANQMWAIHPNHYYYRNDPIRSREETLIYERKKLNAVIMSIKVKIDRQKEEYERKVKCLEGKPNARMAKKIKELEEENKNLKAEIEYGEKCLKEVLE